MQHMDSEKKWKSKLQMIKLHLRYLSLAIYNLETTKVASSAKGIPFLSAAITKC